MRALLLGLPLLLAMAQTARAQGVAVWAEDPELDPIVHGALDPQRGALDECARTHGAPASGDIVLALELDEAGAVSASRTISSTLPSAELADCLTAVAARAAFTPARARTIALRLRMGAALRFDADHSTRTVDRGYVSETFYTVNVQIEASTTDPAVLALLSQEHRPLLSCVRPETQRAVVTVVLSLTGGRVQRVRTVPETPSAGAPCLVRRLRALRFPPGAQRELRLRVVLHGRVTEIVEG